MALLKHLLAATTFPSVRHAVERAALMSQETGLSLGLLHVANLAPLVCM